MPQFHETIMGRRFIEGTMPALVTAVNELTEATKLQLQKSEEFKNQIIEAVDEEPEDIAKGSKILESCQSWIHQRFYKVETSTEVDYGQYWDNTTYYRVDNILQLIEILKSQVDNEEEEHFIPASDFKGEEIAPCGSIIGAITRKPVKEFDRCTQRDLRAEDGVTSYTVYPCVYGSEVLEKLITDNLSL